MNGIEFLIETLFIILSNKYWSNLNFDLFCSWEFLWELKSQLGKSIKIFLFILLTVKRFIRSIETVFYKTSQNISAWPNDLFWALKILYKKKQMWNWEKKKKKKMTPSYNFFVVSLEINCYFWGFWKICRIYSKEFLHTKYAKI